MTSIYDIANIMCPMCNHAAQMHGPAGCATQMVPGSPFLIPRCSCRYSREHIQVAVEGHRRAREETFGIRPPFEARRLVDVEGTYVDPDAVIAIDITDVPPTRWWRWRSEWRWAAEVHLDSGGVLRWYAADAEEAFDMCLRIARLLGLAR